MKKRIKHFKKEAEKRKKNGEVPTLKEALAGLVLTTARLYLTFFKLVLVGWQEMGKSFWRFVEMYAHDRANGRRFDWKKLLTPQKQYYQIGIDLNLIQFLNDWRNGDTDF